MTQIVHILVAGVVFKNFSNLLRRIRQFHLKLPKKNDFLSAAVNMCSNMFSADQLLLGLSATAFAAPLASQRVLVLMASARSLT